MGVANIQLLGLPSYYSVLMTGSRYPIAIDAALQVHNRLAGAFAPHASESGSPSAPNMTVTLDAGAIFVGGALVSQNAQISGTITAPATNPRRDLIVIDTSTAAVSIITGSEAASPSDPALTSGKLPVGRINLTVGMTVIDDMDLDDLRAVWTGIGGGATETVTAGENLADRDLIYQDVSNARGGGATRWYKVDTDVVSPCVFIGRRIGIALAAITSGNTGSCQVGPGEVTGLSGLTAGQNVWASNVAGGLTQTEPGAPSSGSQNASRRAGVALSTTSMYFLPFEETVFAARNSALASAGSIVVAHFSDQGAREREPRAYIAVPGGDVRITGGTPTAPLGGTAAAFNDDNISTVTTTSAIGDLTAAAINSRVIAKLDYGSNQPLTSIEAKSVSMGASSSYNVGLYHSTDGTSWTIAGALEGINEFSEVITRTVSVTARYIAMIADQQNFGANVVNIGDLNGYKAGGGRDEPVIVSSETISSGATDRVTCRFDAGSGSPSNDNINTTFINRTNATRDLIVEVSL